MGATLYSLSLSHPSHAVRLMLERKGIEHRVVDLLPGMHPALVRALGFRRNTVPALRIDGRRLQGSREIAGFLDDLVPDPPLFPRDPAERRAVEEAERWGEEALQPVPRRLFRWGSLNHEYVRRWVAAEVVRLPAADLLAWSNTPVVALLARAVDARDDVVRRDVATLDKLLGHADALIADGTIGGDEPNAADFQIATSVRALLAFTDLRDRVEAHPSAELARRLQPHYPEPIPSILPPGWV